MMKNDSKMDDKSLNQLWRLTRDQRWLFAGAALAMITANVCLFVPPVLGKYAIDMVTLQDSAEMPHKNLGLPLR